MATFTESALRARARRESTNFSKSASAVLTERVTAQASVVSFDVFLSHAYDDRELLAGAVLTIEDLGYSVYIDWREDPKLDRSKVTPATAAVLRERMRSSRCLFYSVTPLAKDSAWMKWELGCKDGHNNRAAILPIETEGSDHWSGQQFLGLYPYVSDGTIQNSQREALWIHRSRSCYVDFDYWLDGKEPYEH
jgi:hypothetical protein